MKLIFVIIIILTIGNNGVFCKQMDVFNFRMNVPDGWQKQEGNQNLFIAKATSVSKNDLGIQFQDNVVVTKEVVGLNSARLFRKDPAFYMEVSLYSMLKSLLITKIDAVTINGIDGVYIESTFTQNSISVSTIQFYFLIDDNLIGVAYSSLSTDILKNKKLFTTSLYSISKK